MDRLRAKLVPVAVHASTGAAGKGGRVKRKKAPAAVAAVVDADQQQQGDSADAAEGREMDVITVGAADETPETWARLLAGLAEICTGIGMALQSELCKYLNSQFRPTGWHRGLWLALRPFDLAVGVPQGPCCTRPVARALPC
jgi:hypothetical protein